MKKQVLGAVAAVALLASTSFGAALSSQVRPFVAFGTDGAKAGITSKMFDASVTLSNASDNADKKSEATSYGVAANYKFAVDNTSSIKAGVRYNAVSGKISGASIDTWNTIALTTGLETELSNNVLANAGVDVFSSTKIGGTTTTGILTNGTVSVSWLF